MKNIIIKVGTVTYAIKLRRLLTRAGIESKQVKSLDDDGCNYGVEISFRDFYSAIAILHENGIDYTVIKKENDLP